MQKLATRKLPTTTSFLRFFHTTRTIKTTTTTTTESHEEEEIKRRREHHQKQSNALIKFAIQQVVKNGKVDDKFLSTMMKHRYWCLPMVPVANGQFQPKVTMKYPDGTYSYHMYSDLEIASNYEKKTSDEKSESNLYVAYKSGYDMVLRDITYLTEHDVNLKSIHINPLSSDSVQLKLSDAQDHFGVTVEKLVSIANSARLEDALESFEPSNVTEVQLSSLLGMLKKYETFFVPVWNITDQTSNKSDQISVLFAPSPDSKSKLLAVFTNDTLCDIFIDQHKQFYTKDAKFSKAVYSEYVMTGTELFQWILDNPNQIDGLVFNCNTTGACSFKKDIARLVLTDSNTSHGQ